MKIRDFIEDLKAGSFLENCDQTRDLVLFGNRDREIKKIGVCWVASIPAIEEAIEEGVNFIISHENPYYHATTSPHRVMVESIRKKISLLKENSISVYRCHDLWDKYPVYGVADIWAKSLGFDFKRQVDSYIQTAYLKEVSFDHLIERVGNSLKDYGQDGLYYIGREKDPVKKLGIGVGAATPLMDFIALGCDTCILGDDAISNHFDLQLAIDLGINTIVVNHSACEMAGMVSLRDFLAKRYESIPIIKLDEGFDIKYRTF